MSSSMAGGSDKSSSCVKSPKHTIEIHSVSELQSSNDNKKIKNTEAFNIKRRRCDDQSSADDNVEVKKEIDNEMKNESGYGEKKDVITDNSTQVLIDQSKNNNCQLPKGSIVIEPEVDTRKRKLSSDIKEEENSYDGSSGNPKRRRENGTNDYYCWKCHKEFVDAFCSACPRSWHRKCIGGTPPTSTNDNWICGECASILQAENATTRLPSIAHLTIDQLCMVLKYVIACMRECSGSEPFWNAVDLNDVPNYLDFVVKPMDLSLLEVNVNEKLYGSTDAFMADAKWIQHNCIVFNTCGGEYADTSKLTNAVKKIIKTARQEISEIEACPDCYARGRNLPRPNLNWFIEACREPHPLIWAKLNGFPYWPAKALPRINGQGHVDVRFFGEHDRAWVSPKNLFLYSRDPPTPLPRKKKKEMTECLKEIASHCKKLELVFGPFKFAAPRIQYNPHDRSQIKLMFPEYNPERGYTPKMVVHHDNQVSPPRLSFPSMKVIKIPSDSSETNLDTTKDTDCELDPLDVSKTPNDSQEHSVDSISISNSSTASSVPSTKLNGKQLEDLLHKLQNSKITKIEQLTPDSSTTKIQSLPKKILTVTQTYSGPRKVTLKKIQDLMSPEKVHPATQKSSNIIRKLPLRNQKSTSLQMNVATTPKLLSNANNDNNNLNSNSDTLKLFKVKGRIIDNLTLEDQDMEIDPLAIRSPISKEPSVVTTSISQIPSDEIEETSSRLSSASVDSSVLEKSRESKDPLLPVVKKPSRAKKSFPNRPPPQPPRIVEKSKSDSRKHLDSIVSTSSQQNDDESNYQLPPPEAGPLSAYLNKGAHELARRMGKMMEEALKEVSLSTINSLEASTDVNEATVFALRLQIERLKWQHQQQLAELKHNSQRAMKEMRESLDIERLRLIEEVRKEAEEDKGQMLDEAKTKQWCVYCLREAIYQCCWNTTYCSIACQESHWMIHMRKCTHKLTLLSLEAGLAACPVQPPDELPTEMPKLILGTQSNQNNGRGT